jgi:hypothetical protein
MGVFEDLCRKAARLHDIPIDKAEKAIRYQFSSIVKAMEQGDNKGVWLQYLGTWGVKDVRKKMVDEKVNRSANNTNNDKQ